MALFSCGAAPALPKRIRKDVLEASWHVAAAAAVFFHIVKRCPRLPLSLYTVGEKSFEDDVSCHDCLGCPVSIRLAQGTCVDLYLLATHDLK